MVTRLPTNNTDGDEPMSGPMNLPDEWSTGTVSADGIELRYYRTGAGQPIVFAHGFLDTGRRWIPLADSLADSYEVITYDARGHGRSDAPETDYRLVDRIADLYSVVDGLGLELPVLIGHSMGGGTVGWAGARRPDRPAGVVLVDPDCLHRLPETDPETLLEQSRSHLRATAERTVEDIVDEEYSDLDPTHARRLATGHLECDHNAAELTRQGYPAPLAEAFESITAPTLVLRPDVDIEQRVIDLEAADSLPNGRLVHVPDAGHYVFRDAFDGASTELRTFLRRL